MQLALVSPLSGLQDLSPPIAARTSNVASFCRTLKRFLGSRELSAELKRVLRRMGPTHESKHFLKTSEFNTQEATRFLKSNGLDVVMNVFFKARTASGQSRESACEDTWA